MLGSSVSLQLVFKFFNLGAHNVLTMLKHAIDSLLNLRLQGSVLRFEIDEGDAHCAVSES